MPKLRSIESKVATLDTRTAPVAGYLGEVGRLRGRAAVDRRSRYLQLHPLCWRCGLAGRVGASTVPDHRIPLWAGGADDLETNGQGLCREHHDAKTACEARMRGAGGWLSTPCSCGQHDGQQPPY